jgi:predicted MFS family arabinose efflux permease
MFATFPGKFYPFPYSFFTHCCIVDLFHTVYGFSPGASGLAYIGLGIGLISATIFGAKIADAVYKSVRLDNPFCKYY